MSMPTALDGSRPRAGCCWSPARRPPSADRPGARRDPVREAIDRPPGGLDGARRRHDPEREVRDAPVVPQGRPRVRRPATPAPPRAGARARRRAGGRARAGTRRQRSRSSSRDCSLARTASRRRAPRTAGAARPGTRAAATAPPRAARAGHGSSRVPRVRAAPAVPVSSSAIRPRRPSLRADPVDALAQGRVDLRLNRTRSASRASRTRGGEDPTSMRDRARRHGDRRQRAHPVGIRPPPRVSQSLRARLGATRGGSSGCLG